KITEATTDTTEGSITAQSPSVDSLPHHILSAEGNSAQTSLPAPTQYPHGQSTGQHPNSTPSDTSHASGNLHSRDISHTTSIVHSTDNAYTTDTANTSDIVHLTDNVQTGT